MFQVIRMTVRFREMLLTLCSVASAITALFHGTAIVSERVARLEYAPAYPLWRHLLFIAVDASCAWLFIRRPKWFVWAFLVLTIQILNSHGRVVWTLLMEKRPMDWLSVAATLSAPIALWLLVLDRKGVPLRVARPARTYGAIQRSPE
jgi:hypothetical protein